MNTPRCRYVVFIVAFEHILDLFHICHILLTLDMYLFAGYLTAFNLFRRENFESFLSHLFYRCLFIRNSVFSLVINKYFPHSYLNLNPANVYLFKVNNRNRKRSEICSKLTIKALERQHASLRQHIRRSRVFIVIFEHISHLFLVFLFLTLNE